MRAQRLLQLSAVEEQGTAEREVCIGKDHDDGRRPKAAIVGRVREDGETNDYSLPKPQFSSLLWNSASDRHMVQACQMCMQGVRLLFSRGE